MLKYWDKLNDEWVYEEETSSEQLKDALSTVDSPLTEEDAPMSIESIWGEVYRPQW